MKTGLMIVHVGVRVKPGRTILGGFVHHDLANVPRATSTHTCMLFPMGKQRTRLYSRKPHSYPTLEFSPPEGFSFFCGWCGSTQPLMSPSPRQPTWKQSGSESWSDLHSNGRLRKRGRRWNKYRHHAFR